MKSEGCKVSQCFNDILGIRIFLDEYPNEFPEYFRVVDITEGKKIDDGYRAIHLYYQKDSYHYPIEVQLWCGNDIKFNMWSHISAYKYVPQEVNLELRELYDVGLIIKDSIIYFLPLDKENLVGDVKIEILCCLSEE